MALPIGQLLRCDNRLLRLLGVLVHVHDASLVQFQLKPGLGVGVSSRLFQLLQRLVMLPLFLGQRPRQLHFDGGIEIAAVVRLADVRHAMALEAEDLAVLRALWNLQPDAAGDRRHLGFAAEDGGRDRHRNLRLQVAAVPFEHRVRFHLHAQVQVARGSAVAPGGAFAGRAHARALLDADRNTHVDRSRVAAFLDRDTPRGAVIGLFQRQLDGLLDVLALLRPGRPAAARPAPRFAASAAEERAEEVRERILVAEEVLHLLGRHGAVAAAGPAHVDRPGILRAARRSRTDSRRGSPGPAAGPVRTSASSRRARRTCAACRASPSTSYASLISLNLDSAVLSPGLTSGWNFLASLRNACLISFSVAVLATPSVW